MSLLETTVFVFVFVYLISVVFERLARPFLRIGLIIGGILISVANLLMDGYRWQMVPVYVFLIILLLVEVFRGRSTVNKKGLRIASGILGFLLFSACLIFPMLLPVVDLPSPTGEYAVGTSSFRLTDVDREEIFSEDPDDIRNILVTAWYPAEVDENAEPVTYWDQAGVTGEAYSLNAGMGSFWYSHLTNVKTNSYAEAPISTAEGSYPVLIYSHSFVGLNTENSMLFEELASQGYIVLSVAHSYESIIALFPDGEKIDGDYEYIDSLYDSHHEMEDQLYKDFAKAQTKMEKEEILRKILVVDDVSTHMMQERSKDILYVLDQLPEMNEGPVFQSEMDLEKIGVFGWSFGGATAVDVCILDERCDAVINIDGWPYGEAFTSEKTLEQPLMLINSGSDDEMELMIGEMVFSRSQNNAYRVRIFGAEHTNFWDFPLFFDVYQYLGYWGPIDAERLLEIENAYIVGFFDNVFHDPFSVNIQQMPDLFPETLLELK